jgi:hypothetical protein
VEQVPNRGYLFLGEVPGKVHPELLLQKGRASRRRGGVPSGTVPSTFDCVLFLKKICTALAMDR